MEKIQDALKTLVAAAEPDGEAMTDSEKRALLEKQVQALGRISKAAGQVHLAFPMASWIVEVTEGIAEGLRGVSSHFEAIKFRIACSALIPLLEECKEISPDQISTINNFLERHVPGQGLTDKESQEVMCCLLDQCCTYEENRTSRCLEITQMANRMRLFLCEVEKEKLGANASGMLNLLDRFYLLADRLKERSKEELKYVKGGKGLETASGLVRVQEQLAKAVDEWKPRLEAAEQDS